MKIAFENLATASTSTLLPKGNYAFEIDGVDPNYVSQNKGTKGLEVKAHVIAGMDFEDGSSTVGIERTIRLWYPHGGMKDGGKFALGQLNEFAQGCGLDTSGNDFDTDELVGRRFTCTVKIKSGDKGDNEDYSKFGRYDGE